MYVIPLSDDDSQIFRIPLGVYGASINVKFPRQKTLSSSVFVPPIMDIYVDGYQPIYGIPMIPRNDLLHEYSISGCLPLDLGSLICVPDSNDVFDRDSIVSGQAALVYFTILESVAIAGVF